LAATAPDATGADRLDTESPAATAYLEYLATQHEALFGDIEGALDRSVEVAHRYDAVLNGIAVSITAGEAEVVASLPGVRHVERDSRLELHTDNGPRWIGADEVWGEDPVTGNADCEGTCGEGVVIGVIDTGTNHDHPSFADIGGDGYDHANPRGRFFGACDPVTGAPFCNDKLIGFWDFTGTTPEDDNGHGTHTASTSGGNVLTAVMEAPTFTLERDISGVAPHANIISYKGCSGNPVIGCQLSALVGAINQATLDMVDVINYSIGGSSANPWSDLDSQAFFDAYSAGILVVTSAGNAGPGSGTLGSPADAPWVTAVGASTHDRKLDNGIIDMAGGNSTPPADIFGKSLTAGLTPARVVYAGDYGSSLCGEGASDPTTGESEINPFPSGTFNGEIVVCDRGTYGRVAKAQNVADGGAGGYVLANDAANGDSLNADPYPIPGVHISFDDGVVLKQWIADGGGIDHTGTGSIQGTILDVNPAHGDIMASFSSRGPNPAVPGLVKPDVTAPGVDILAAWMSPLGSAGDPPEFNVISGTSMSSPHTAGAGALVRAVHPDWSPDEVKAALMTTAFTVTPGTGDEVHGVLKEDSATPADPFDMGAGRVDLRQAATAGLVLDETVAGYETANPALGGDPSSLNLPSLGNDFCTSTCEWTRTVKGTAAGTVTWSSSTTTPTGMTVTVSPASFTLSEGETVTLTITADVAEVSPKDVWTFAEVQLTPSASVPAAHLPIAVLPTSAGPRTPLHFHGNLHDGCTGDGALDLTTGECTPFLSSDPELDTAPAASWGPINVSLDCTVDRCISDPNWIWELDGTTTLQGPMTVGWWFGGPGVNTLLFDDFEIRLYADGTEVLREVVRHNVTVPNVPEFLQSTVDVPKVTASDNYVLVIDPLFVNQNESFIYYDSTQPCPGVTADVGCDSTVLMPVSGDVDLPPDAQDDQAFVLNGGTVDIDVLANDSDPEGGPLAVEIVSAPTHGTADVNLDNSVRYTHDGSATTSDSFVYQITDNAGQTDTATVFVTISDQCFVVGDDYHDDFESGAPGWTVDTAVLNDPASQSWLLVTDALATSPTNSWFTDALAQEPDGGVAKDVRLVSPAQLVSDLTHLTFWHRFDTEPGFDGGVLEVSLDGGATWEDVEDAGGVFLANGYNSTIDPGNTGNPLQGRDAWSGPSSPPAGATEMLQVQVDLGVLAGKTIQVRYRFGQDELVGHPGGWWIDDVTFTNLFEPCGEPPVANDDSATVANGGSTTIDVKANDSDPDDANADLTVTIETPPSNGSAEVNADDTVTYTHDGSATTSDSFQYRLTDPDGGFDVATVSITVEGGGEGGVDQATGAGFLEPTSGKKINFNFDVENQDGTAGGDLKLSDKTRGVKIAMTEVTLLGSVESECGSVPAEANSAEFHGTGTHNGTDASFRVCVQDNGETGDGDLFYLECVTGCTYSTGEFTDDDVIDGGNIQVQGSVASPGGGEAGSEETSTASVLMLDPLLLTEGVLGTAEVFLVTVFDANGDLVAEGVEITLTWTGSEGSSGSATALTDALGVAAFTIIVDDGDIEYLAWAGDLSSNAIDVTGLADPTEGP
jgi:subtilisin family serine protease